MKGFTMENHKPTDFMNRIAIGANPAKAGDVPYQMQQIQEDVAKKVANVKVPGENAKAVTFPTHLYLPEGARSIDIRRLVVLAPGSNDVIMSFQAPEGSTVMFTHYGVFNDALDASLVEFVPTVNFQRVYPFQGDPNDNFRINLGLTVDLGNNALIEAPLQVNPGDTVRWTAVNNDVVNVIMGVRMKGYIDSTGLRPTRVFGG